MGGCGRDGRESGLGAGAQAVLSGADRMEERRGLRGDGIEGQSRRAWGKTDLT